MGEVQNTVDAITAQATKAKREILGKIQDLEHAVAAGEVPNFDELRAVIGGLDNIVPDEAPADEAPVDEAPVVVDTPVEVPAEVPADEPYTAE
ncbi:hypothetical protein SEA_MARSHAWN_6 [Mycobacterium phage Marshawn]|uniref:Uncharacterized protein n=1 Tax=Mycobacterium phage Marshawn TaxID=2652423 RepID=A0A5P8D8N3_9CAUD|nr:hypothetical protein I5H02_gp93 [Mycobacterium phage Marshawn]QFP94792.1 hypothetical protein SEA_MARSHAWN_6 [Mycobacterium phage Marshawn]